MSVKITAKGNLGELKAIFNALSAHPDCLSITSQPYHMHKDLTDATQTFECEMRPAKEYKRTYRRRETSGYVYLLATGDSETWKIGKTIDPKSRRQTFKLNLPFQSEFEVLIECDDMHAVEKGLHRRFSRQRVKGTEFFKLSERDVEYIRGLA